MQKTSNQEKEIDKKTFYFYLSQLKKEGQQIINNIKQNYKKSRPKASEIYQKTKQISKDAYNKTKLASVQAYENTTKYIYDNSDKITNFAIYTYQFWKKYQEISKQLKNGENQLGENTFDSFVQTLFTYSISKFILPNLNNLIGVETLGILKTGIAAITNSNFISIGSNTLISTLNVNSLIFGYAPVIIPAVALTYGGYKVYVNVMEKIKDENSQKNILSQKQKVEYKVQSQSSIENKSQEGKKIVLKSTEEGKRQNNHHRQVNIKSLEDYIKSLNKHEKETYKTL